MNNARKGENTSPTNLLAAIIIISIIIILVLYFTQSNLTSIDKVVKRNIDSLNSDYDGDRIPDYKDASPCVAGEDLVIATNGNQYMYFADAPDLSALQNDNDYFEKHNVDTEDRENINSGKYDDVDPCQTVFYDQYFPDLETDVDLKSVTEQDTNLPLCVMEEKTCAKLLQESYDALKAESEES